MKNRDELLDELIDYWETLVYQLKGESNSWLDLENPRLSEQEIKVIIFLGRKGEVKMKDIVNYMNLVGSTLTSIIDKLVKKECVKRRRSESDRRIVKVSLAQKGESVFEVLRNITRNKGKTLLLLLDYEEQKTYVDLMRKMVERSKKQEVIK